MQAGRDWLSDEREWLEPDRLGGFAMGTASGIRTRRYHSLLTAATRPPTGRVVLVNGLETWLETAAGCVPLSSQRYAQGVIHPDGHLRLAEFSADPWPTWTWRIDGDLAVVQELFCEPSSTDVVVTWRRDGEAADPIRLAVRPLLSVRDYHSLHHENGAFCFDARVVGGNVAWRPYDGQPGVTALTNGQYDHAPTWYRQFLYEEEQRRGLDHTEDLASPGLFRFALGGPDSGHKPEAVMVLRAGDAPFGDALGFARSLREMEWTRRRAFGGNLARAADAYLVRRDQGLSISAGYPWFTDWGRDTFVAVRGLCMALGRWDEARQILGAWTGAVSEGMLPNRFPDAGEAPEYNSVDASLWYVVVVGEFLDAVAAGAATVAANEKARLLAAVDAILTGYANGTRYAIHADDDGLIAAGVPGVQLTWMDAKVGEHVITPRIGKPVEIQALWINALAVGERLDPAWRMLREKATASFVRRFPRDDGSLFDVVDVDHVAGRNDPAFRPNQIFAVGGLPLALLEGPSARALVDAVEARLWTPLGLRSLAPDDPAYVGRYEGGVLERDGAYHQGTVWPWLAGPFIEAWVRTRSGTARARTEARRCFLEPLMKQVGVSGIGHLPEIADADAPHHHRGTPFQAWSVGELIRIQQFLGENKRAR